jgi:hypothetical protein
MNCIERLPLERLNALKNMTYDQFKTITPKCKSEKERKEYFNKVKEYAKSSIRAGGVSPKNYYYVEGATFGRMYGGSSIQGICADIRGFLFRDITTDVDFQNCHPKLLEYICKKNGIDCPNLCYYNQNRKIILDRIPNGKELFLKSVNSDKKNTSCKDEFFKKFDTEMKKIQQKLYSLPIYDYIVQTIPKDRTYNCLGSNINRILCKYENEALQLLIKHLTSKNIEVCSLAFDGCMIYGNHYHNTVLLTELMEQVKEYGLVVTYKEHSQVLNIDDFPSEDEDEKQMTDKDATMELIKVYPHWKMCGSLYVFDETTGMWSADPNIHIFYVMKYGTGLHSTRLSLIKNVLGLLPSQVRCSDWMEQMEDSSLGFLLFKNGIYSFKHNEFREKFDPNILFFHRIEYDYSIVSYDIRERIFYQQHGQETGDYLIENLARALAGDCLKNIGFCLGTTNSGKSRLASILQKSLGGYVGTFQGECLAMSNSTADEASKNRWLLDVSKKRIIYSNEIKTDCILNGNYIKKISSGEDRLVGRGHYQAEQLFKTHFLPLVFANDLPQIKPFDEAMDGRTLVFPFNKQYSMTPTDDQLQADPNLSIEMETVEFKLSVLHTLLNAYQEFMKRGKLTMPEKCRQSRKEWIDAEPNLMESFRQSYEITNNEKDFIPSSELVEWVKGKGITITKLGRDINKYCESKKYENVKSKQKKVEGRNIQCWVGIRSVLLLEETTCEVITEGF